MKKRLLCAALCVSIVIGWQWLTVRYNYGGNWTALFETGSVYPLPPALDSEHIYTFPNSYGFDGQFYHLIAHDPLFRQGLDKYVDAPRLRYRRVLVPALAAVFAAGNPRWVDPSCRLVCWLSIFLGAYWLGTYAALHGRTPFWGFLFLLFPATIVSVDRLVADAALAALVVAFALLSEQNRLAPLYVTLAAAALTRETGLLLLAGYVLFCATQRHWSRAFAMSTAALPCFAWYWFVQQHTRPFDYPSSWIPGNAIVQVMAHPSSYPEHAGIIQALDAVSVLAVVSSFFLALVCFREPYGPSATLFALLGIFLQRVENWQQLFDYGRVYTPVLAFLALYGLSRRVRWAFAPLLLVTPRLGLQLAPQILGIARGVFSQH
jgi:hypothetical protein